MSRTYSIKLHKLSAYFSDTASEKLRDLATRFDAVVIMDGHGDVALLRRHYDSQGVQQVRFAPDPGSFYPVEWWTSATLAEAEKAVC